MPAPIRRRFINVISFMHGAVEYNCIRSVSWTDNSQRIVESGDGDKYVTFQAVGVSDSDITIEMTDPVQAQTLRNAIPANITFQGEPETGGTAKLVTITGFQAFGRSGTDAHNAVNTRTIRGHGRSSDGVLPIISEALVVTPP